MLEAQMNYNPFIAKPPAMQGSVISRVILVTFQFCHISNFVHR